MTKICTVSTFKKINNPYFSLGIQWVANCGYKDLDIQFRKMYGEGINLQKKVPIKMENGNNSRKLSKNDQNAREACVGLLSREIRVEDIVLAVQKLV